MNKRDENMEWEKEAVYLASLSRTTPYRVPEQYFDNLGFDIQRAILFDELKSQTEHHGFKVPSDYFEDLNHQINAKIAIEEIRDSIGTEGFVVPIDYFDQLQANILAKTTGSPARPKVVKLFHAEFVKYVSAACVILLTASVLYLNQQQAVKETRTLELASEQMLYDIDESVIIEHLQEGQTASTTNASESEVESYILDNFSSNDLSNNL